MGFFLRRGYVQRGTPASDLEIGQSIQLNLGGKAWDWLVVHQGLPSSIYDVSCDGTWLLLKNIYEKRKWHSSNENKLESSTIHSYLNGDFLNLFDGKVKGAIKQVKIPYRKNGGSGGTDQSGANGLPTKVFLLSGYEVGFTTSDSQNFPHDGAKLSYFESGASTSAKNKRIAKLNDSAYEWWLRSPSKFNPYDPYYVSIEGSFGPGHASYSYGIRPAIILPSDMLVTDDMLA